MSEKIYTWRYLCDTCAHWQELDLDHTGVEGVCGTTASDALLYKKTINDAQSPNDVCGAYEARQTKYEVTPDKAVAATVSERKECQR